MRIPSFALLAALLLALGVNTVRSADLTWTNSVSSDWNNAANWIPQQIPTASDHVIINSGSVTIPADGVFAIMDWAGGSIAGSLSVATNAGLNISGSAGKYLDGPLTNAGSVVWSGSGQLLVLYQPSSFYYGAIYNLPGGLFDIQTDARLYYASGNEVFDNAGTLRKSAGGGITYFYPQLNNTGMVDVESGTLAFEKGGSVGGQFTSASGAGINLASGNFVQAGSPVFGGGGQGQFTGDTLTLLSDVIPGLAMNGGSLVLGPAFQGGSITNLTPTGMTLTGTNTVTGALNWTAGIILGSLSVATNAGLNISGSAGKYLDGPLTNAGSVVWSGSGQLDLLYQPSSFYYGAIYNLAGGLFDIQTDARLYYASGNEVFDNAGTLRKSAGGGITYFYPQLNNTGMVDVESGTLAFEKGGSVGGQFTSASGAGINLASGNFVQAGSPVFGGGGQGQFTGDTLTLLSDVIPGLAMNGGSLVLGPAFQGGSITNLTPTGMTLTGTNTVTGALNWTAGIILGSLSVATNAGLNISGSAGKYLDGPLTNAGSVVWSGSGQLDLLYQPSSFYYGAIYNLAGGLFDIQTDARLYYASGNEVFDNAGTLRKSAGGGTTQFYPQLNNTGLVEADAGTLAIENSFTPTGGELRFGLSSLTDYGKIAFPGSATLNGTVGVVWLGGYVPATNNSFTVLNYGSYSGLFTALDLPAAAL